jgi:glycine betaine/proline transport system ATP-binding protein
VQIGSPEALVTQPATDYVRRFVAKVPPARVMRVASLMTPGAAADAGVEPVPAAATIAAVGPRLVAGPPELPVVDAAGRPVGRLDRLRALGVLAGGP